MVLLEPFFCGKLLLDLIWFTIKARWARSLRPDRHLLSTTGLRIRHFSINNQKIYINQHQLNININCAQFWRCMKITKFTLAKYHTSDGDSRRNLRDMQKPCAPSPKSRTCCVLETTSLLMLSTVTNLFHHVDGDASGWTYWAEFTNKVKPPFQNTRFRTFCFLYEGRVSKSSTMID